MPKRNADLHGSAPDKSPVALLIVDVINDLDFPEAKQLLRFVPTMARKLAKLKARAKAAGVPVIYVNDNFGRWRSDVRKLVEHCRQGRARELVDTLRPDEDDSFVLKPNIPDFSLPHSRRCCVIWRRGDLSSQASPATFVCSSPRTMPICATMNWSCRRIARFQTRSERTGRRWR